MFIFKDTLKRANPHAAYTSLEGTRYPRIPLELLTEIPDPVPPADYSDDTYYRTEQDDAPYVVYTRKSQEQIDQTVSSKLLSEIDQLERNNMLPRVVREFMLSLFEAQAAAASLDPMLNKGYVKLKALDSTITAKRKAVKVFPKEPV